MKNLILIAATLFSPIKAYASTVYDCNNAVNKTASYLRVQTAMNDATKQKNRLSPGDINAMINTSKIIISGGERMILLCRLNYEMTENVIDIIIKNTEKIEQLTHDKNMIEIKVD